MQWPLCSYSSFLIPHWCWLDFNITSTVCAPLTHVLSSPPLFSSCLQSDLIRPGHSLRRVVAPVAAFSLICFRTSFLPYLFDCLAYASASGTAVSNSLSVSFSDADSVFQTHPFFYACGTAFAAVVALLRRMHVLL